MRLLLATAVTATVAAGVFTLQQQQGPSAEDFCDQLEVVADLDETLATLDPVAVSGVSPQLRSLHESSPDRIRDDVAVLVALTDDIVDAVSGSPGKEARAVEAVARSADLDAVAEAGVAVERYAEDECGLALSATTDTTSPAPPPTRPTSTTEP